MTLPSGWLRTAVALLVLGVFAGCATAYQPKSFTGGFDDRLIDDNTA
jgi:hypothetical protein